MIDTGWVIISIKDIPNVNSDEWEVYFNGINISELGKRSNMRKFLFQLELTGFESLIDLEENFIDAINSCDELDAEYTGTLIITVEYEEDAK